MLTVITVERVTRSTRGQLSRWLIEIGTGVFVGNVSARVRNHLWSLITNATRRAGACCLVYSAQNEQGFGISIYGDTERETADFDGLQLVRARPQRPTDMVIKPKSQK